MHEVSACEELQRRGYVDEACGSTGPDAGSRDGICTAVAASDRAVAILNGEIPAVFINGVGKANPSAEEVLAEFERTR